MPGAHSRPDGELSLTMSSFASTTRTTLTFQMTPRLSGSFRYTKAKEILFDRSFSLHYRFVDETDRLPAIAVGVNDFLGTGFYSSEYFVASKTITPRLRLTAGIGWGRLAGVGGFTNPLAIFGDSWKTRPGNSGGQGGEVQYQNWFRGDAAFFGGAQWQATEKLMLTAEYSSDAYTQEDGSSFTRKSPFNFGATYKVRPHTRLSLNYLYGSEVGVQLSIALNPKNPKAGGGYDKAPPPVIVRSSKTAAQLGWHVEPTFTASLQEQVDAALKAQDLVLQGFTVDASSARIVFEGATRVTSAQSIGRVARSLTGILPNSVEKFVIVPMVNGIPISQVTIRRTDLEQLEYAFDGSWSSFSNAKIEYAGAKTPPIDSLYPRFKYGLSPYLATAWFDPDQPLRADLGIEASARYEPSPGLIFSGIVRKKIIGNLASSTRVSDSVLQHVRSDSNIYDSEGDPALTELTGAYYFRPGQDLYGRVTVGYLERMFGGVSAEILWKPTGSRFGLGAEVNYVQQRDFDQRLGFQNYGVATGHVSGYWEFDNGLHTQVDVGRYLAGDWGATLTVDREFKNGWRVGAFATLTNVSFDDFGEGSFDKGIRLTIPIGWVE